MITPIITTTTATAIIMYLFLSGPSNIAIALSLSDVLPRRDHARKLVAPQCVLIRTEAGWPGSLNRFPVSVISVPLTFRMEISWSR
jgi:hypothetical protein